METSELIEIISRGEDSRYQFKENLHNVDSLAGEIVAFCNSGGGTIIVGVNDKTLAVTGLRPEDIARLNQLLSNAASQSVKPPINPQSENVAHPDGLVMVINIPDGISKPYMDNKSSIWVKCGSDKRKVTSREEMQRIFQSAGLIHGDELPANGLPISDIDLPFFEGFFQREYAETIEEQENPLPSILEYMNLAKAGVFNVAGALLFAKNTHFRLPTFIIKTIAYPGNIISTDKYLDSRDINGKISDMFQQAISFISMNVRHQQNQKAINSVGDTLIPKIVLEELIVNALIHRDYFITAPIRVLVFADRVEIISPGHLPNNLTVENIILGNSNIRNPILASFAAKLLPYRGLGSGIIRALKAYPNKIEFKDDRDGNMFKVSISL